MENNRWYGSLRTVSSAVPKTVLKVIVLGDSGVGKSTVINAYCHGNVDLNLQVTVGVHTQQKDVVVAGEECILDLRDTAGQERYRSICSSYYRSSDACILMFALDDKTSFENLDRWRKDILEYVHDSVPSHFPFVVVGNKCDQLENPRKISVESILTWCNSHRLPYFETTVDDFNTIDPVFENALFLAKQYKREQVVCNAIAHEQNRVVLASVRIDRRDKKCCF